MVPENLRWQALLLLLASGACQQRPAAPALTNSRVYQNASEGFRFLVPEGWIQTTSSSLPPGPLTRDVFLVRYRIASTEAGATFVVLCIDDKNAIDLESHHAGPLFGVQNWRVVESLRTISINQVPSDRIVYEGTRDKHSLTKIVTCIRRKGRLYSFVGVFGEGDATAEQQIERATDDVIWSP